jgi:rhombotail lipoprotein
MKSHRSLVFSLVSISAAAPILALTGCDTLGPNTHRQASSVVQYLYPKNQNHTDAPSVPVLSLPLKVGVAFVPEEGPSKYEARYSHDGGVFTEEQKMDLMKSVSASFSKYPFVQSVQLIPSIYLRPAGGFANLDQIRSMFGIDVIVLLSYDQVQFRDEGLLSLTYLTVVGAYTIPGEKNDTQTMIDAVAYDLGSHQLLFRAPGTSQIKGVATPINITEELRHDSERGFKNAAADLEKNFTAQLASFREELKKSPEQIRIETKPGYTRASVGGFGWIEGSLAVLMCLCGLLTRRNGRSNASRSARAWRGVGSLRGMESRLQRASRAHLPERSNSRILRNSQRFHRLKPALHTAEALRCGARCQCEDALIDKLLL